MLTRAIFAEGCKSVAAGMNPMDLRRGINLAVEVVLADLKARTKMISTKEEITQVRNATPPPPPSGAPCLWAHVMRVTTVAGSRPR